MGVSTSLDTNGKRGRAAHHPKAAMRDGEDKARRQILPVAEGHGEGAARRADGGAERAALVCAHGHAPKVQQLRNTADTNVSGAALGR